MHITVNTMAMEMESPARSGDKKKSLSGREPVENVKIIILIYSNLKNLIKSKILPTKRSTSFSVISSIIVGSDRPLAL